ncbi:hypothetical protein ABIB56_000813 [Glaciihabitans sp. UYNi722]
MIRPKQPKPSEREQREAYDLATLRDFDVCVRCRRDCGPTARDHRINRSQGGLTVVSNLQVMGLECHKWATEHPAEAIREGWAAPSYATASEWPARRWFRGEYGVMTLGWVLLDDAGNVLEITSDEAELRMKGGN